MIFHKIKTWIFLIVVFGVVQGCSPFHRYIFIRESLLLENQEKKINLETVKIYTFIDAIRQKDEKNFHSTTVYYGKTYHVVVICDYTDPIKNIEINNITVQADDQAIDLSFNLKSNQITEGSLTFSSIYFDIDYENLRNLKVYVDCTLFMSDGSNIQKSYSYIGEKKTTTDSASWIVILMGV